MTSRFRSSFATGAALLTLLAAPFFFGAVVSTTWVSLAWTWIVLGAWSLATRGGGPGRREYPSGLTRAFLAVHVLMAIQLIPLPPSILHAISPGSYAANYVPPPDHLPWAALTASTTGTLQAWLFFAGLHGLTITLFGASEKGRSDWSTPLFYGMAAAGALLAVEGLVQAASEHPFWLYGAFAIPGVGEHEKGVFGPYYDRDHYSNIIAVAASVAAGLLARRLTREDSRSWLSMVNSSEFPATLALVASLVLMFTASAASGSRGGLAAISAGVVVGLSSPFLRRPRLALVAGVLLFIVLFSTGVPSAIERMGDVDFEAAA